MGPRHPCERSQIPLWIFCFTVFCRARTSCCQRWHRPWPPPRARCRWHRTIALPRRHPRRGRRNLRGKRGVTCREHAIIAKICTTRQTAAAKETFRLGSEIAARPSHIDSRREKVNAFLARQMHRPMTAPAVGAAASRHKIWHAPFTNAASCSSLSSDSRWARPSPTSLVIASMF